MCERWLLQWGVEKSCESWTDWMSYFSVSKQNCEVHWLLTDSGLAHIGHSASEVVKGFLVTCWACYSQCELLDESSNSTTVWQPLGKAHCVNTVPPSVWQRQPHDTSRPALIQPCLPACLPVCQPPIQPVMQLKCQRTNLRFRPHTGGCVNTETHTHILGFFCVLWGTSIDIMYCLAQTASLEPPAGFLASLHWLPVRSYLVFVNGPH